MNKDVKIKYLLAASKLYEVKDISFFKMLITAIKTDKLVEDVPPEEVFDLMMFKNYKVTLINECKVNAP